MGWFRRKRDDEDSMDPQVLLARANEATPPSLAKLPGPFRLTVDDVFTITGRGTVVTGTVESGSVSKGETLHLARADGSGREVTVAGIEMFRKVVKTAAAGDTVGLLLERVARSDIGAGDVLTA